MDVAAEVTSKRALGELLERLGAHNEHITSESGESMAAIKIKQIQKQEQAKTNCTSGTKPVLNYDPSFN